MTHGCSEGTDGSIGVANESGIRSGFDFGDGKDGGDVLVFTLNRVGPDAFPALGAATPVHRKAGVAVRQQPGYGHPVGVGGDAAMHEDNCGTAAQAAKGDARSVGGMHQSFGHRHRRMIQKC